MTNKLELTWIGKEQRPRLEPRILVEDADKSHANPSGGGLTDNLLIHGDNLLALKALESTHAGQIKCAYIDPPYNTGSAFEHYDDGVEHSLWLTLMRDRLEAIRRLLRDDGSLWIQLDDNEVHYCKVLLDEVFGRKNFIASVVWQKVFAKKNKALISGSHDTILVYAKNANLWNRNLLPRADEQLAAFKNPDQDARGPWQSVSYSVQSEDSERRAAYRYKIRLPNGDEAAPPAGRHWNGLPERTEELRRDNRLWFGPQGDRAPRLKVFLSEVQEGIVPDSWWTHEECGNNQDAKKEMLELFPDTEPFATPKPERLLMRVLAIATNPGDWVLDSFAGSGTTGAVAHKMGRHWIMVELLDHCETLVLPRMRQVCDGAHKGGISAQANWQGGGGFRYFHLAPSLLKTDKHGQPVINPSYNAEMLAEAMCKLEGFRYEPSQDRDLYWMHGRSTESDFVFVTTQTMTRDQLSNLHEDVGHGRTLLVCCGAFHSKDLKDFPNLTVKKIPKTVLAKCEWNRDDYSLKITSPAKPEPNVVLTEKNNGKARKAAPKLADFGGGA